MCWQMGYLANTCSSPLSKSYLHLDSRRAFFSPVYSHSVQISHFLFLTIGSIFNSIFNSLPDPFTCFTSSQKLTLLMMRWRDGLLSTASVFPRSRVSSFPVFQFSSYPVFQFASLPVCQFASFPVFQLALPSPKYLD